jgi:peptidoglycan/xylan/chitin deacetylase (PgdA/CDA1 family)
VIAQQNQLTCREHNMNKGKLTISIDLELAWGVWDNLTNEHLQMAEGVERSICAALVEVFDRYEVPATWAIVAALLHEPSSSSLPGSKACWYAPDIVELLAHCKSPHEIGSHGGRHVYFNTLSVPQAQEDLEFAKEIHRVNGLSYKSFVFPRNAVGHLDVLCQAGLQTFRGRDVGWFRSAQKLGRRTGRAANFVDKFLPIAPQPAVADNCCGLVNIPGSMLLMARNGARRFIFPQITRSKLRRGLRRAQRSGSTFHLWFHPSNFYYRREEQLSTLAWFLAHAADEASRGLIEICTMGTYAATLNLGRFRGMEA